MEELAFSGALSLLKNFKLEATYEGEYLNFDMDWAIGESGAVSFDLNQDEPIEIIVDDLFPDNPTYDLGGGVIISQDFHFDIKWNWIRGEETGERGYFKINEDTNEPNFDWIGITFKYTPSGYDEPQYGVEVGGYDVGIIVWMEWYWVNYFPWLKIWWYTHISGDFYLHLLWQGDWYYNVDE